MSISNCNRISVLILLVIAIVTVCFCAACASDFPSSVVVYSTAASAGNPSKLILYSYPSGLSKEIKPRRTAKVRIGDDIRNPILSPEGKRILVSANRVNADGTTTQTTDSALGLDMWIVNLHDGGMVPITLDAYGYENYSWSPDGNYICSVSYDGRWDEHPMADAGQKEYLYLWNVRKPAKKLIGLQAIDYAWSIDSKRIYHTGEAYSVKPSQEKRSSFIYADIKKGKSFIYFNSDNDLYSGRWSPNGEMFAYCEWNKTGYGISILCKEKNDVRRFLNTKLPIVCIEWSPDNKIIAFFESVPYQNGGDYQNKLKLLDVGSGAVSEIWSHLGETNILGWTNDSKWVVASRSYLMMTNNRKEVVASSIGEPRKFMALCTPAEDITGFDWIQR